MDDIRKADQTFTGFVPKTAFEAVDRYTRCRRNGLRAMMIPECLIECSRALPPSELDKFENWIINPHHDLSELDLVPSTTINESNDNVYKTLLKKATEATTTEATTQEEEKGTSLPASPCKPPSAPGASPDQPSSASC